MHLLHYCPNSGGFMFEWHRLHFLDELESEGYVITDCNPVEQLGRTGTAAEYSEILLDTVKQVIDTPGPHLFLAASGTDSNIEPSAVDLIRSMGMPTVNACFDANTVPFKVRRVGAHFDITWTTNLGTEDKLREYGCNPLYMAYAANPRFFKSGGFKRDHVMCFVGSRFGARALYVANLSQAGVPLKVRGGGWSSDAAKTSKPQKRTRPKIFETLIAQPKLTLEYAQLPAGRKIIISGVKNRLGMGNRANESILADNVDVGPGVSFSEMVSAYASCTASLGVLEVANTHLLSEPLYQVRLRDFEAPMIGCAHLVHTIPELQEAFEEDSEMIFYSSVEECIDKARFYLDPQQQGLVESIGVRAQERAKSEHTWLKRFSKLREILGM